MRLGSALRIAACVLLGGAGLFSSAADAEPKWNQFSNKYQWEVSVPECWENSGIEDAMGPESPIVTFMPGKNCPPELGQAWGLSVTVRLQGRRNSPEARNQSALELDRTKTMRLGEKKIGGKVMKARWSVSQLVTHPAKWYNFVAETFCDGKVTTVSAGFEIPKSEEQKSIDQLQLPAALNRMLTSFNCKKP